MEASSEQLYQVFQSSFNKIASTPGANPGSPGKSSHPHQDLNSAGYVSNAPISLDEFGLPQAAQQWPPGNQQGAYSGAELDFPGFNATPTSSNTRPPQYNYDYYNNYEYPQQQQQQLLPPPAQQQQPYQSNNPSDPSNEGQWSSNQYGRASVKSEASTAPTSGYEDLNLIGTSPLVTAASGQNINYDQDFNNFIPSPQQGETQDYTQQHQIIPQHPLASTSSASIPDGRRSRTSTTSKASSSSGGAAAKMPAGRGKRKKNTEDDVLEPTIKAQRDKDRRFSNNTRERMRIRDINDALTELGRICMSLEDKKQAEKPQTKLGILNMAVDIITKLEQRVRDKNLNPSVLCLNRNPAASASAGSAQQQQQQPQVAMSGGHVMADQMHMTNPPSQQR